MLWSNPIWAKVAYAMAIVEAGGEYFPYSLFYKWWAASQVAGTVAAPPTSQSVLNPKTSGGY
jgi:hypothetical protein